MGFPIEFAEKREQAICPLTSLCSSCPLWFNIFHSVNGYKTIILAATLLAIGCRVFDDKSSAWGYQMLTIRFPLSDF